MSLLLSVQTVTADVGTGATLLKAIKEQKLDETIEVLNDIKRARHRGDVLPLLIELWSNDKQTRPDVPWAFVNLDVVRINIADILVQAYRNGQADISRAAVHAFAKNVATASKDVQARATALLVLGIIDDPRDVTILRAAATEERDLVTNSALIALGSMCNRESRRTLDELVSVLKGRRFIERVKDAQQMQGQMVDLKSGWCAQRPFVSLAAVRNA